MLDAIRGHNRAESRGRFAWEIWQRGWALLHHRLVNPRGRLHLLIYLHGLFLHGLLHHGLITAGEELPSHAELTVLSYTVDALVSIIRRAILNGQQRRHILLVRTCIISVLGPMELQNPVELVQLWILICVYPTVLIMPQAHTLHCQMQIKVHDSWNET